MTPKNQLESKSIFREKINEHFHKLTEGKVPEELLSTICELVTDFQYNQNKKFWEQYPKSRKTYSKLKVEDLKHPFVSYLITDFLKPLSNYRKYAKLLLQMNDQELDNHEIRKRQYYSK